MIDNVVSKVKLNIFKEITINTFVVMQNLEYLIAKLFL